MKVALVAPSSVPFTIGGAERAWAGVVEAVNQRSEHDAELLKVPVSESDLPGIVRGYEAFWRLDVSHFDAVISTKYPAWMVRHPNHIVWMFHKLRGLYDTYHVFDQPEVERHRAEDLAALQRALGHPPTDESVEEVFDRFSEVLAARGAEDPALRFPGPLARQMVHFLDAAALAPGAARRHLSLSHTVAQRQGYFPSGVTPQVLYCPSSLEGLHGGPFEGFFTASRLDGPKRIGLLISAMRHVRADVPLRIGGTGPLAGDLAALAAGDSRIEMLGYVPDAELVERYAHALAIPFLPEDEDLGLIALEAMMSGKPVITCSDSGGPTELVRHGETGIVCAPDPRSLGDAMGRLAADPGLAARMGDAGQRWAETVTWDEVVRGLLGRPRPERRSPRHRRRHVVVTSTFPVAPRRGGGQLRSYHLYGALAPRFDVEVISLTGAGEEATVAALGPGFTESTVPVSDAQAAEEAAISAGVGLPVNDITAGPLIHLTPDYVEALARALQGATAVVLAHPFLLRAVELTESNAPLIYDAHNAETRLKDSVLPRDGAGDELRSIVATTERAAVERAALTVVCALDDARALEADHGLRPDRTLYVPNGTDVTGVPFVTGEERRAASARWRQRLDAGSRSYAGVAGFIGSWHPPNLDAVDHLIEVAAATPDVAFVVAGSVCDHYTGWRVPPNLMFLGAVTDGTKRMVLQSLDLALNPMRRGSGSNLKLVEYLASGTPVVSTRLGIRGTEAVDGEHVRAVAIEDFAETIHEVLDDPVGAERRAAAGRRLVEASYDWHLLGRRMCEAVSEALSPRRAYSGGG